jgi:hypothetical protein
MSTQTGLPHGLFSNQKTIWVNFGGSCYGKILVYFMTICSILRPLEIFFFPIGIFCGILVYFPRFGLATLLTNSG